MNGRRNTPINQTNITSINNSSYKNEEKSNIRENEEIIMVAERRTKKTNNDNKPYKKTTKKSLKENPQPIKVPTNNQEPMEMEVERENNIIINENNNNNNKNKTKKDNKNEEGNNTEKEKEKEKEKDKERKKEKERENETEALNYMDPSFINEPTIDRAKRNNKKERAEEIKELAKEIQLPSEKKKRKDK